tara:strand:+ start:2318 stop:2545 length:228 start_codon:yes stop_codon:yes gene_type:complete
MSHKNAEIFSLEFKHSMIFWGCKNGSQGEDYYTNTILPFNIGDKITRNDKTYKVISKDWDYDNNNIYFIFKQLPK